MGISRNPSPTGPLPNSRGFSLLVAGSLECFPSLEPGLFHLQDLSEKTRDFQCMPAGMWQPSRHIWLGLLWASSTESRHSHKAGPNCLLNE